VSTFLFFILKFPLFYSYVLMDEAPISILGSALCDPENSEQALGNSGHQAQQVMKNVAGGYEIASKICTWQGMKNATEWVWNRRG
jgi:hypothetical protein